MRATNTCTKTVCRGIYERIMCESRHTTRSSSTWLHNSFSPSIALKHRLPSATTIHRFSTSSEQPSKSIPMPSPRASPSIGTTSSSVSSDEVSKFSSMASTWWKVEHNPLISMNPIRMSFITDQISKHRSMKIKHETSGYEPFKGLRVLDVGCGGGLLSESMARLGASVIAIDPSVEVAKAAQTHSQQDAKTSSIDYRGGTSVEELASQEQGTFDVVCVLEVIEHATDPRSLMEAAVTLLKKPDGGDPGGMLFVSTINRTAKSFGIAIVGGEYISGKLPIGTHSWNQFLSPAEVNGLVGEFGLDEVDKKGMILRLPLYDMRWYFDDNDLDVNWIGSYSHRT